MCVIWSSRSHTCNLVWGFVIFLCSLFMQYFMGPGLQMELWNHSSSAIVFSWNHNFKLIFPATAPKLWGTLFFVKVPIFPALWLTERVRKLQRSGGRYFPYFMTWRSHLKWMSATFIILLPNYSPKTHNTNTFCDKQHSMSH